MAVRNWARIDQRRSLLIACSVTAVVGLVAACRSAPSAAAAPAGQSALSPVEAARCQGLKGQTLGGALVVGASPVARGEKGGPNLIGSSKALVPFCRVDAVGSSGPGSSIKIQVLLPVGWNSKLVGVGGGGLSGGLTGSVGGLMRELARGYAGVANDAGHTDAKKAAWAIGAPARVDDFGFKANHVAAVSAKAVIAAYYGEPVERSYFNGCSNGGRDAMMLAQRFPEDYDGIVAGAPAINWTGLMASAQANYQRFKATPGAEKLPSKLAMVREAVIAKCDKLDGVADNVLENPLACSFDPAELQCADGQKKTAKCLAAAEVDLVRAIYRGPQTSDGRQINNGYPPSSEYGKAILPLVGWGPWFLNGLKAGVGLSNDFFRGIVTQDPNWDPETFVADRDYALAKARVGASLDALDPNLEPFVDRGGKLFIFHGWEDAAIPAEGTIEYYGAVQKRLGAKADAGVRLFMAPGMAHCSLGHGPDTLDLVPVIDSWVTTGLAPQRVVAAMHEGGIGRLMGQLGEVTRTRPLCAWPKTARYKGTGSTDLAENFTCEGPAPSLP